MQSRKAPAPRREGGRSDSTVSWGVGWLAWEGRVGGGAGNPSPMGVGGGLSTCARIHPPSELLNNRCKFKRTVRVFVGFRNPKGRS